VIVRADNWVNAIALTPDQRIVLIEQYRSGTGEVTLEIPGGIIDGTETPEEAGLRELREESGYAGRTAELIGSVHPNPAFMTNRAYTVLVRDVEWVGDLQQDDGEDIAVRLVPLAQIPELIRTGAITHAIVIAAFYLFEVTR